MAADKFPIQSGHIMMFARAVGDANTLFIMTKTMPRPRSQERSLRHRRLSSPAHSLIQIISCAPRLVKSGSAQPRAQQVLLNVKPAVVAVVVVAYMPNNIMCITEPPRLVTY